MSDFVGGRRSRKSDGLELMANVLESGWAQGWRAASGWPTWNFDEGRAVRRVDHHGVPYGCCIAGAERFVELMFTGNLCASANLLPEQPPDGFEGWTQWNDAEGRTQEQVVEYVRNLAAIERIREAHS